jgi:threo-3-hydroxy-L-aspartate ammonia-lyase
MGEIDMPQLQRDPTLSKIREVIRETNFITAPALSALMGANLTFADESAQHTGSFKFRAAFNLASKVSEKHIITASSGNFGQALAYACKLLGKRCTVVMPTNSATVKVEGVKSHGGAVEFVDTREKSRAQRVQELSDTHPEAYVASAYDNPLVIEGNSTLGMEIAQANSKFEIVVVPVGGGGLSSGIIVGIQGLKAEIAVVGAEPAIANDAAQSFREGKIVSNQGEPQTIADGARTVSLGKHNWPILQAGLRKIIEVPEDKIVQAMKLIHEHLRLKVEPTGALALGAVLTEPKEFAGKNICCVISGGNVDSERFESLVSD